MKKMFTTARLAGLFYLGLAITGVVFLLTKNKIYVDGDALATSANLVGMEATARLGVAAELAIVGFQALAAVWFYKLFSKKNSFAAWLIAVFGMVNAIAILIANAFWLSALNSALAGNDAQSAQLLFDVHESIWLVSELFFGAWLIPMGYMVVKSKMFTPISWFLIGGGIGYVISVFVSIALPDQTALATTLPLLATVGEFWIIGYLLFKKVKI